MQPTSWKPTSRDHQLALLRSTANDAIRAVVMQAHRMREGPLVEEAYDDEGFQRQTDARFLMVALRWLHRCCAAVADVTGDPAHCRAVEEFEAVIHHVDYKDMRDVWEHVGEYVLGRGRLQRADRSRAGVGEQGGLGVYTWTGPPDDLGSLSWAGLTVSFDTAVAEGQRLYAATREA